MTSEYDKLSFEDLENYIEEISSGYRIAKIKDSSGKEHIYIFKHPSVDVRRRSQIVYDSFFNEAKEMGLSTIAEMEDIVKKRGIFTEEDEEAIKRLEDKVYAQQQVLRKTFRVQANRDRLVKIISDLKTEIRQVSNKKEKMLQLTCEAKAAERRTLCLLVECVYNFDTIERVWKRPNDFEEAVLEDDAVKFNLLIGFVNFMNGIQVSMLRQIARSSQWRLRYIISKKVNVDLFGVPVKDFSCDQLSLMQWSDYYASIYEMLSEDRPPDSIIEDDVALDAYMEEYFSERSREDTVRRGSGKKKPGKVKSAYDHDEVIITKSNPLHKDIEYSKVPKKVKSSESTEVTERQVQERDKLNKRRIGSPPPVE